MADATTTRWTKTASDLLRGRKIVQVRYMTLKEAEEMGWSRRPVVLVLDDGNQFFPMSDDEGNDAGALMGFGDKLDQTLPILR
jgi:hypothetical protein